MVEATKSYKERMRAARAEARAKRQAEKAEWRRQIELMAVVRRLSLDAAKATIQDRGDRVTDYDPAQLRVMANAFIHRALVGGCRRRRGSLRGGLSTLYRNLWTVAQRAARFPNDHALKHRGRRANAEYRVREHLTEAEVVKLRVEGQSPWSAGLVDRPPDLQARSAGE